MALISGLMGMPFALSTRVTTLNRIFRYAASVFSLVIGVNIVYQIGFVNNLFGI
jgi:hypothetical protein